VLAVLLGIDLDDPADADDLDALTVLVCRRMLREGGDEEPPDRPRLRVVEWWTVHAVGMSEQSIPWRPGAEGPFDHLRRPRGLAAPC
jgi:hypothetical protein